MSFPGGGGFVGNNVFGTIKDCYSTGLINGPGASVGGFCGGNWGTIADCFWDLETSGEDTSDGGAGRYTGEMKIWTTFEIAYWAIAIWAISMTCNGGYPCLLNVTPFCEWIPILLPSVETDSATDILAHGATLHGDLTIWG